MRQTGSVRSAGLAPVSTAQRSNFFLGLVAFAAAALLLLVWIPLDVETGIIEKVRRRVVIGDGFAPTIAGVFLLLGAVGLLIAERKAPNQPVMQSHHLHFIALVLIIIATALTIMRFAGPVSVTAYNHITGADLQYRLLRDTVPWKYLGFFCGGTILISGLISVVLGKFSWKSVVIGITAVLVMIAVYDFPFDDLLLPPNGDV